jgi:hypothetical protein
LSAMSPVRTISDQRTLAGISHRAPVWGGLSPTYYPSPNRTRSGAICGHESLAQLQGEKRLIWYPTMGEFPSICMLKYV